MKFFDSKIKIPKVKKSKFNLTHEVKLTCNMGKLVPVMLEEIMPGDNYRMHTEMMMRMAPMIAPMMHQVNVYLHSFFVPMRMAFQDGPANGEWERFIAGNQTGDTRPTPVIPVINLGADQAIIDAGLLKAGSLIDYMGAPTYEGTTPLVGGYTINRMPFIAYNKIYDEYYRDQDLQVAGEWNTGSDPTGKALITMKDRAWEKDYFTSARPFAQKGGAVGIPFSYKDVSEIYNANGTPSDVNTLVGSNGTDGSQMMVGKTAPTTGGQLGRIENLETLATINEFREANALQKFLEKLSRSGNRYIEYLKMIFTETSSDSRLQRPEYLGGGRIPVVISEVLSTYDNTGGGLPQGNQSGHGISVGSTQSWSRKFNEHGYVISILSIIPRTGYQQGLDKIWFRKDQFDFPIPDFAHLGEQAILNKEVYFDPATADAVQDNATFGYQSRYSECKFKLSKSHGDFRTNLQFYTMDRIFPARPALNKQFVMADPTTRVFAIVDPTVHHLWINMVHSISAIRPLPYHGTPTL